jgi:GIY-YIG catalytic domain
MSRRRRQDCNHAVYLITNVVTDEIYIGITVCAQDIRRALRVRVQKHIRRALTENRDWALCRSIREYGVESFTYGLIEVVRGRKAAHSRERQLIKDYASMLNTR